MSHRTRWKSDIGAQPLDGRAIERVEGTLLSADLERGMTFIVGVDDRVDEVVGGAEPQAFGTLEQREVLQMRIGVADDQVEDDQLEIACEIDPRSGGVAFDDTCGFLVG